MPFGHLCGRGRGWGALSLDRAWFGVAAWSATVSACVPYCPCPASRPSGRSIPTPAKFGLPGVDRDLRFRSRRSPGSRAHRWESVAERFGLLLLPAPFHHPIPRDGVALPPVSRPLVGSREIKDSERTRGSSRRNRPWVALPTCAKCLAPVQSLVGAAWSDFSSATFASMPPRTSVRARHVRGRWGSRAGDEGGSGLPSCLSPGDCERERWPGQWRSCGAPVVSGAVEASWGDRSCLKRGARAERLSGRAADSHARPSVCSVRRPESACQVSSVGIDGLQVDRTGEGVCSHECVHFRPQRPTEFR